MALELGLTPREIEEEMSISEYKEWQMYFQDNPAQSDVNEIQMAQLMTMLSSYMGGKSGTHDFLVRAKFKIKGAMSKARDIMSATADDIDKLLGNKNG